MLDRRSLLRALAVAPFAASAPTAKQCVLIWLNGGASHIDTFDPKPGTKNGGPFKAIATRTSGLELSEHLPKLAASSNLYAVIRGVSTAEGNHQRARYLMHTGYVPNATVVHPSLGAWVAHEQRAERALPSYVSIGFPAPGAGFFGAELGPFEIRDPSKPPNDTQTKIRPERLDERLRLRDVLDAEFSTRTKATLVEERRGLFRRAAAFMRAPELGVFALDQEPQGAKMRYGDHAFGRGCLLARRLIEAQVPFVEVGLEGWDTHEDGFARVKALSADLDDGLSALLADLAERRLLERTLVLCMTDFGRTPTINARDGRDHYPHTSCALIGGAGARGGIVHGSTDAGGVEPAEDVSVPAIMATAVSLLGLDTRKSVQAPSGRPITITDYGEPIAPIAGR